VLVTSVTEYVKLLVTFLAMTVTGCMVVYISHFTWFSLGSSSMKTFIYLQPLIRKVPELTSIAYRKIKDVINNGQCTDGPSPEDRKNKLPKSILKL